MLRRRRRPGSHRSTQTRAEPSSHVQHGSRFAEPTPIYILPRSRTILLLVGVIGLVALFWSAPIVLNLLVAGAALALVLSFPVHLLDRIMPRGVAIFLTMLGVLLLLIVALILFIPPLIVQLTNVIQAAPALSVDIERLVRDGLQVLDERGLLRDDPDDVIDDMQQGATMRAQDLAERALASLLTTLTNVFDVTIRLFGVLFIAIYLLVDIRRFKAAYLRLVAPHFRHDALALWDSLGHSLSRYLGGLIISMSVQGVAAAIALSFLGVPYALLLGLVTALTAILPYIGAFLGAIPAIIVALTISPGTALLTAIAFLAINQIEGNVLMPRIQGQAVRAHPLFVFLAVVAGGAIAGIAGSILAVPTLAVLRVLFDFFAARLRVHPALQPGEQPGEEERSVLNTPREHADPALPVLQQE